ncbi:hypothetical protein ACFFTQ_13735 [Streptomyces roseofulvus]
MESRQWERRAADAGTAGSPHTTARLPVARSWAHAADHSEERPREHC